MKNYDSYTEKELYAFFDRKNWTLLDEAGRQSLLQEVVDRQNAQHAGAYCATVEFVDMSSHTYGYQIGNQVFLSRDIFVNDCRAVTYNGRTIELAVNDSNWKALETVLHENRHVYQEMVSQGVVPCDDQTKALFVSNNFTVSIVDGERASQYMKGENDYAFYYLNPTELDAFKTSQDKVQQIIAELSSNGMTDESAKEYLTQLKATGYMAKLEEYRITFNNENVEKEIAQVLRNSYFNLNVDVDKSIESAVKNEMIETQKAIDLGKNLEMNEMKQQEFTENGFTYTVDENGTVTAKGTVNENPASRAGMNSIKPDGYDSSVHDKGHLIAARQGGVAEDYNVSAQDRHLNRGAYKSVENAEVRSANKGYDVQTEKTAYVSQPGAQPDAYMVNDTITTPDGNAQTVHLSFQNMSPEEQDVQNNALNEMNLSDEFDNPNAIPEGLTNEEYTAIMDETEQDLPSVKDEFDMSNTVEISFDQDCINDAHATFDSESASSIDSGNSASVDSGVSSGVDSGSSGGVDGGADGGVDGGADI